MRVMMKVTMEVAAGNKAIQDESLPRLIKGAMEKIKPEAAYFLTEDGKRTCLMVVDMKDSSEMPALAEPFFNGLNADVRFTPVMNQADLEKGLIAWMQSKSR